MVPKWPALTQNSSPESLMSFSPLPWLVGGIKCILCDSPGRGFLVACVWFPLDFAPCALPFADFYLSLLGVINHSCGYDYMLSPLSPPGESSNWRWAWGPMAQVCGIIIISVLKVKMWLHGEVTPWEVTILKAHSRWAAPPGLEPRKASSRALVSPCGGSKLIIPPSLCDREAKEVCLLRTY